MSRPTRATAAAPASVGNVGVGFDVLGHAIVGPVDRVTVQRIDHPEVRIAGIEGVVSGLPLEAERNTAGRGLLALRDRLALTHGFEVTIEKGMNFLTLLGPNGRLATGDPGNVPVGIYAQQALTKLGVWESIEPHLARTEDVRAALLLVARGEAPLGIVYATDAAVSPGVGVAGVFPSDLHDPIAYPFAVTRAGDTPEARAFLTFLAGPVAAEAFHRRGFITE